MYNQVTNQDIIWYGKCSCGAITFQTEEGTYSYKQSYFHKHFPNVNLRKCKLLVQSKKIIVVIIA